MPQFETSTYIAQIVWLLICFFSLWFALSWFIIPRIEDILAQRRHKIDGYIQKAEQINKKALSSLDKYETALKKAKDDARKAIDESNQALCAELAQQRADNQHRLAEKIADNQKLLEQQRHEALKAVDDMSVVLALDVLHKVGFADVSEHELKSYSGKE